MAAPRRRRRCARATRSTCRSSAQPQQALRRPRPEDRRGKAVRCVSSSPPPTSSCRTTARGSRRVSASTTTRCARSTRDGLRLDLGVRRGRPVSRPARPGPAAAGDVGRVLSAGRRGDAAARLPASTSPTPSRRRPRSRACSPLSAPRAHRRGPARDGQHARRPDDLADAGALGLHRRRQDAGALAPSRTRTSTSVPRTASSRRATAPRARLRRPARTRSSSSVNRPSQGWDGEVEGWSRRDEIHARSAAKLREKPAGTGSTRSAPPACGSARCMATTSSSPTRRSCTTAPSSSTTTPPRGT